MGLSCPSLTPSLTGWMLCELFNLSMPQFPYLEYSDKNSHLIYFWEIRWKTSFKCLAHGDLLTNTSSPSLNTICSVKKEIWQYFFYLISQHQGILFFFFLNAALEWNWWFSLSETFPAAAGRRMLTASLLQDLKPAPEQWMQGTDARLASRVLWGWRGALSPLTWASIVTYPKMLTATTLGPQILGGWGLD